MIGRFFRGMTPFLLGMITPLTVGHFECNVMFHAKASVDCVHIFTVTCCFGGSPVVSATLRVFLDIPAESSAPTPDVIAPRLVLLKDQAKTTHALTRSLSDKALRKRGVLGDITTCIAPKKHMLDWPLDPEFRPRLVLK